MIPAATPKGLRQFLDGEQQRAWLEGETTPEDADERSESLEQRFKYASRFEKLRRRPQAPDGADRGERLTLPLPSSAWCNCVIKRWTKR